MTEDSLVTPKAMRSLGTQLAYEHVCEFLREQGGRATTKAIQDHQARVALMENHQRPCVFQKRQLEGVPSGDLFRQSFDLEPNQREEVRAAVADLCRQEPHHWRVGSHRGGGL